MRAAVRFGIAVASVVVCTAACTENAPPAGEDGEGGGGVGGGGGGDGGSGVTPGVCPADPRAQVGRPCPTEGESCRDEACTDACQLCQVVECSNGEWTEVESSPASCFSCGELECAANEQYCLSEHDNVGPGEFTCLDLPAECAVATCACLASGGITGDCEDHEGGGATIYYGGE